MAQPNVVVRPSPFVLRMTAGSSTVTPSVTRFLNMPPLQKSPKIQVGQQKPIPATR